MTIPLGFQRFFEYHIYPPPSVWGRKLPKVLLYRAKFWSMINVMPIKKRPPISESLLIIDIYPSQSAPSKSSEIGPFLIGNFYPFWGV